MRLLEADQASYYALKRMQINMRYLHLDGRVAGPCCRFDATIDCFGIKAGMHDRSVAFNGSESRPIPGRISRIQLRNMQTEWHMLST